MHIEWKVMPASVFYLLCQYSFSNRQSEEFVSEHRYFRDIEQKVRTWLKVEGFPSSSSERLHLTAADSFDWPFFKSTDNCSCNKNLLQFHFFQNLASVVADWTLSALLHPNCTHCIHLCKALFARYWRTGVLCRLTNNSQRTDLA